MFLPCSFGGEDRLFLESQQLYHESRLQQRDLERRRQQSYLESFMQQSAYERRVQQLIQDTADLEASLVEVSVNMANHERGMQQHIQDIADLEASLAAAFVNVANDDGAHVRAQTESLQAAAGVAIHPPESLIDEGANILRKCVIGVTPDTREDFKSCIDTVYSFFFSKAIYLYTLGNRKSDEIPMCFDEKTRTAIGNLRTNETFQRAKEELKGYFTGDAQDGRAYNELECEEGAPLAMLKQVAGLETGRSFLLLHCWGRAAGQT